MKVAVSKIGGGSSNIGAGSGDVVRWINTSEEYYGFDLKPGL